MAESNRIFTARKKPFSSYLYKFEEENMNKIRKFTTVNEFDLFEKLYLRLTLLKVELGEINTRIIANDSFKYLNANIPILFGDSESLLYSPDKDKEANDSFDEYWIDRMFPEAYIKNNIVYFDVKMDIVDNPALEVKTRCDNINSIVSKLNEQKEEFNKNYLTRITFFFFAEKNKLINNLNQIKELGLKLNI